MCPRDKDVLAIIDGWEKDRCMNRSNAFQCESLRTQTTVTGTTRNKNLIMQDLP